MSAPLVTWRAGRSLRQGDSNTVVAQPERGLIYLCEEEGLTHFCWKEGASNETVEDLIIFPGDASFLPIPQSRGTYVLKFSSSDARHFFWAQDPDETTHSSVVSKINDLIDAPERPELGTSQGEDVQMSATTRTTATQPTDTNDTSSTTNDPFASVLASFEAQQRQLEQQQNQPYSLPGVVSSSAINLLVQDSAAQEALYQFFPTGIEHTPENLRKILHSSEYKRSLATLDTALRTGALAPLVTSFGLEPTAALGIDEFLSAIQKKADADKQAQTDQSGSDAMQTD